MRKHDEQSTPEAPAPGPIDTVLMSGGAPNSPLMAGFLYALLEEGNQRSDEIING